MDPGGHNNSIFFNNETYNKIKAKTYEEWSEVAVRKINEAEGIFFLFLEILIFKAILFVLGNEFDLAHGYPDLNRPFSFWKEFP